MSDWILYYNPRCGTCRKVKERLEAKSVSPRVVEYLQEPPSAAALEDVLKKLGAGPEAITRYKEPVWQEKFEGKNLSRTEWIKALAENPILIQRPIVLHGDRAVVARPPEEVDRLFT